MKILLTGGHLTPALALIDYLRLHKPEVTVVFVGREFARSNNQVAHERAEVTKRNIQFVPIHSGKLSFSNPAQLLLQSLHIILATLKSLYILLRHRPAACVTFGSYLAVPIALAAWILRIPLITHEQTKTAGFANRLIGVIATKIAISYPESESFFSKRKTLLTGNLIREQVLEKPTHSPEWAPKNIDFPILYITGGSQGSEIINSTVAQALRHLLKDAYIIHQCGNPSGSRNYLAELQQNASQLPNRLQQRYLVKEWFTESELAWIYTHATAAISRAGANSVEELALRGIPTLFIPLPFSLNDEQLQNAQALSEKGQGMILPQKSLNPEVLATTVQQLFKQSNKIRRSLQNYQSKSRTALADMTALIDHVA